MEEIILPKIISAGVYNADIAVKNRSVTKNRRTTMFEIELPIKNGGISYIDDTYRRILANTVICAKPGQIRHTRLPFCCRFIHIILNEGKLFSILSSLPNYIELQNCERISEIFIAIEEHYASGNPESDIILQSLILELIYLLEKSNSVPKTEHVPKKNNRKIIEDTVSYINENLTANLSLESLAARANFSSVYFHKLFKSSTGKTLRDYIEEQRIKKSIILLTSSELTLTEIAYECGFSSQSYFSYAFKKRMKSSPREYAARLFSNYES